MKKIAILLCFIMLFLNLTSCGFLDGMIGSGDVGVQPDDEQGTAGGDDQGNGESDDKNDPEDPNEPEDPTEPEKESIIVVNEIKGLNEQIYLSIEKKDGVGYSVYFKGDDDSDYSALDENLMLDDGDSIDCYILGIKKGDYQVKIEAECENRNETLIEKNISVVAQDRSGYAHFGYTDGIGAYNSDGTVKEGAVILYVTNENKNTVTMTIAGEECVGLVNIMQRLYKCEVPVLIRIIGKITTNQWNYKNVEPRLAEGSNLTDDFFVNTFSNEYGTNLANLKVRYTDKKDGKTYTYTTTEDGLSEVRVTGSGTSTTTYKGSDFPSLKGKTVYDDDSYINVIEVKASKNITIEGVGPDAEFFQFGVGFEECQSIEIKNMTFTSYPEDALNFMVGSDKGVDAYGNYWLHNNTFNAGYNAWDITGERDKFAGDGTIDFAFIHNVTVSYNVFKECKKTMLVGNSDSSRCMNITIHHNYFYKVGSRIPLARNTNIHTFNNYFEGCSTCSDIRKTSYLFSEANYYKSCNNSFVINSAAVKSYGDIFEGSNKGSAVISTSRTQTVTNSCKPDQSTDYSKFDTNPELFYYDAVNMVTIADHLLSASQVPEFVLTYAGAGVFEQLPN